MMFFENQTFSDSLHIFAETLWKFFLYLFYNVLIFFFKGKKSLLTALNEEYS